MKFPALSVSIFLALIVSGVGLSGCSMPQARDMKVEQQQTQEQLTIQSEGSTHVFSTQDSNPKKDQIFQPDQETIENNIEPLVQAGSSIPMNTENIVKPFTAVVNSSIDKPVIEVESVKFVSIPQSKILPAIVSPNRRIQVTPKVAGIVAEVIFKQGQWVEKGEPLYRLKSQDILTSVETSKSAVKQAQAQLVSAQTAHRKAKTMLQTNQSILKQAKADLARYEVLIKDDAVSEQTYQQAVTNVKTARSSLKSTQVLISQTGADIKTAQANIQHAKNELSDGQQGLDQTVVTSPISGRVLNATIKQGQKVTTEQTDAFVEIAQVQPIFADIALSADELIEIQTELQASDYPDVKNASNKDDVKLVLANGKAYAQSGTLTFTETKVNNKNQAVMRVLFPNADGILLPDMQVTAKLKLSDKSDVMLVAPEAVSYMPLQTVEQSAKDDSNGDTKADKSTQKVHYVFVLDDNKRIHRRIITVDGLHKDKIIVTKGLNEGDKVVVKNNLPLIDKQLVVLQSDIDIQEADKKAQQALNTRKRREAAENRHFMP